DEARLERTWRDGERPCLFLLDGSNEVSRDFQQACVLAVREFTQVEAHRYVITARPGAAAGRLVDASPGFEVLDLVPLDTAQVEEFLAAYDAASLYERLGERLRDLVRNPFLLWVLARSCRD